MGWGGSGRLSKFDLEWEGGGLGVGAYQLFLPLGWVLIRGRALIRINTVQLPTNI